MANFTCQVRGVTVAPWNDPAGPSGVPPSRVNPRAGFPHRRLMGKVGTAVTVEAVVGGVVAPLDPALVGQLFSAWFVQLPEAARPGTIVSAPGRSSVNAFTPPVAGHYVLGVRRDQGGLEHIHVDVE
jgi:hypothetical protein